MKYYVYFNDDYHDNGGVGFEEWDTLELALTFIESRLKLKSAGEAAKTLRCYQLIRGSELKLQPTEVITKVTAYEPSG